MVNLAIAVVQTVIAVAFSYWLVHMETNRTKKAARSQAECILELCDEIDALTAQLHKMQGEIDDLYSVEVAKSPNPKPPVKVDPNLLELPSDNLPLHGHTLIVGQSGSGKTNVLMSQIIRRYKDGQELHCIDTKNEIGPIFKRHITVTDVDGAEAMVKQMLAIAEERQACFAEMSDKYESPCRSYSEYEKLTGDRLPVVTLIVEEMIVLMTLIPQEKLVRLLVLGRSAGVFVLALAQYIKADIMDRKGTINFNTRVFLGKYDRTAATLLFGSALDKEYQEFLGSPGKAVVEERGELRMCTMPEVKDSYLKPFMKKQ